MSEQYIQGDRRKLLIINSLLLFIENTLWPPNLWHIDTEQFEILVNKVFSILDELQDKLEEPYELGEL